MNEQDRKNNREDREQIEELRQDINVIKADVGEAQGNIEMICACQNDLCDKVDTIMHNHLAHMRTDIQVLIAGQETNKRDYKNLLKLMGVWFAGLGILMSIISLFA